MIMLMDHDYNFRKPNELTQWYRALVARGLFPAGVSGLIEQPGAIAQYSAYFLHAGNRLDIRDAWIAAVREVSNAFLILISANGPQELMHMTREDNTKGIYSITWTPQQFVGDLNATQFVNWLRQQLNPQ